MCSLPATFFLAGRVIAPVWFTVLESILVSLGVGVFRIALGATARVIGRNRKSGSLEPGFFTSIVSMCVTYAVISAQQRGVGC